jgi:hypothetical protein
MLDPLRQELADAEAALRAHMASWEFAFANGSSAHGATAHPTHWATHPRTEELRARVRDLRARLAEHEL